MSNTTLDTSINKSSKQILLSDCTYKNTDKFSFIGKIFEAKCVKVYDGDSITVVFKLFDEFKRFSVRMNGYDSPEIRSKNDTEKQWAIKSRDFLSDLILNKIIYLECNDYDKYGRILGVVKINNKNVNLIMLDKGYSRPYDGGYKKDWDFSKFT